jgi:transcriptional regulator with XRE-family HTH domain
MESETEAKKGPKKGGAKCRELLARNIKKYRKRMGLSQETLSFEAESSATFIKEIEMKRKFPSPEYIERIAKALHVEIYELFEPEQEELGDDIRAAIRKQLDQVEDGLVAHIAHSIKPTVKHWLVQMRTTHKVSSSETEKEEQDG